MEKFHDAKLVCKKLKGWGICMRLTLRFTALVVPGCAPLFRLPACCHSPGPRCRRTLSSSAGPTLWCERLVCSPFVDPPPPQAQTPQRWPTSQRPTTPTGCGSSRAAAPTRRGRARRIAPPTAETLAEAGGPHVSESTLSRVLRQLGLVRQPVPSLTKAVSPKAAPVPLSPPSPAQPLPVQSLPALPTSTTRTALPTSQRCHDTDLSNAEWSVLEPLLPAHKPGGRRPKYALREIVNGIQYVLRIGRAWRHIPHDLPHWEAC